MKKIITLLFTFAFFTSFLQAEVFLNKLIKYDKATCLERLKQASTEELWDTFLNGQSELFFEPELNWIKKHAWWYEADKILEIGSGNGAFLYKLRLEFKDKQFYGIEKLEKSVQKAKDIYGETIIFQEGDAEVFDEYLPEHDVILFRLTLQHLKEPILALQYAAHYLRSNGHILIIDSCDQAKQSSHPLPAIDKALENVANIQQKQKIGNRKITLEILQMLDDPESLLSKNYELESSNLDQTGKILHETMRLEGMRTRKKYFNHNLLFATLLHRTYHVDVDMDQVYDELLDYYEDENAWTILGMHYLALKKRS